MIHADAAWKAMERGAPSPRQYERLLAGWLAKVRARLRLWLGPHADATATDDEAKRRKMLRFLARLNRPGALPPPPDPDDILAVGARAATTAARASRQGLLFAGYPRAVLEQRIATTGGALVGIDIAPTEADRLALRGWAKDGTDLIVSVSQDLVKGLDEHIVVALRDGRYDLGAIVEARLGVSERHARFIARDQIAKLSGAITEGTQRAAGVTRYKWRSSRDERTRDMHRALDGTIQSWDAPPVTNPEGDTNHPGEDYQCRCNAIPIIDGVDLPPRRR